jgi:hypothetical protein
MNTKIGELISNKVDSVVNYTNHIYLNQKFTFYKIILCLWFIWLSIGTLFYTLVMRIHIFKGFYMAVNVGYSIGWSNISEGHNDVKIFSLVYLLIGVSFVGAGLNAFSYYIVTEEKKWYVRELDNNKYILDFRQAMYTMNLPQMVSLWCIYNWTRFEAVFLLFFCMIVSTVCACTLNDWKFIDGIGFTISCLSSAGFVTLSDDAPEWYYGITALFCAIGIPLMTFSIATIIAGLHNQIDDIEETKLKVISRITEEEIKMLDAFQLLNTCDEMNKAEFIILCMLRKGINLEFFQLINEYFYELDLNNDGILSVDELTNRSTSTMTIDSIVLQAVNNR